MQRRDTCPGTAGQEGGRGRKAPCRPSAPGSNGGRTGGMAQTALTRVLGVRGHGRRNIARPPRARTTSGRPRGALTATATNTVGRRSSRRGPTRRVSDASRASAGAPWSPGLAVEGPFACRCTTARIALGCGGRRSAVASFRSGQVLVQFTGCWHRVPCTGRRAQADLIIERAASATNKTEIL